MELPIGGFLVLIVLIDRASFSVYCGYTSCDLVAIHPSRAV